MTPEMLTVAADQLAYEIYMFRNLDQSLKLSPDFLGYARSLLLESYAVHARSLVHFFFSKGKDDDALAEHYFPESEWTNIRGKLPDELDVVWSRKLKEIVHIRYRRVLVKNYVNEWDIERISSALNEVIDKFIANAPKRYVTPEKFSHL